MVVETRSSSYQQILESAVALTREEELLSLRRALIRGVEALEQFDSLDLFEISSDIDQQREGVAYYRNALEQGAQFDHIERRTSLFTAMHSGQIYRGDSLRSERNNRYAIPIRSSGNVSEILFLESTNSLEPLLQPIEQLLEIYRNHSIMLYKYEHDSLTGLLNRRSFEDRLRHYMEELLQQRTTAIPHLAVLDIDHFKRINDNFGHLYGDDVLLIFADRMKSHFAAETSLYRFGGEEFVVMLSQPEEEVERELEGFRALIKSHHFPQVGQVTVSIGYTAVSTNQIASEIISRADQALYYAKENGRNRICSYEHLVRQGKLMQEAEQEGGDIELF